jgi:hypothetical protein
MHNKHSHRNKRVRLIEATPVSSVTEPPLTIVDGDTPLYAATVRSRRFDPLAGQSVVNS